jgi:hypothetical protein
VPEVGSAFGSAVGLLGSVFGSVVGSCWRSFGYPSDGQSGLEGLVRLVGASVESGTAFVVAVGSVLESCVPGMLGSALESVVGVLTSEGVFAVRSETGVTLGLGAGAVSISF